MVWPPNKPAPCGGWKTTFKEAATIGDLHQHYNATIAAIAVRHNVTKVYNPLCTPECCDRSTVPPPCDDPPVEPCCPSDTDCCQPATGCPPACPDGEPATVAPTPRPACVDPSSGDGTRFPGCDGGVPCGPEPATLGLKYTNGNCAPPQFPPVPCGAGEEQIGDNCYSVLDTGVKKDFSTCRFLGFKNVIAYKQWHGAVPFGVDCPISEINDLLNCDTSSCGGSTCSSKPFTPTNGATKKYLSSSLTISITRQDSPGVEVPFGGTYTYSYSGVNSVDRHSGELTRSGTAAASKTASINLDGSVNDDAGPIVPLPPIPDLPAFLQQCALNYSGTAGPCGNSGTLLVEMTSDCRLHIKFTGERTYIKIWISNEDGTPHAFSDPLAPGDESVPEFYTYSGTRYEYFTDTEITWTLGDGEGGGTYTSDDVMADLAAALATWNLQDHALYPPRLDSVTNGGPLVTYNERDEVDLLTVGWLDPAAEDFPVDGWVDPTPPKFPTRAPGSIVGAPAPVGSEPYFDIYHKQWDLSDPDGPYGYNAPIRHGQLSSSAGFYCPHMTMWTDELHHQALPHGPFVFCRARNGAMGASLFLPHYHGAQNDQSGGPGGVWAAKWAEVLMFEKPPHNYQRPCGADDAQALNMDTIRCDLPDDPFRDASPRWSFTKCDCDDTGFVGQVSAVTNATPVVMTLAGPHGLADGAVINICNVKGCTAANGKRTVMVVTADTVQLFDGDDPEQPIAGNGDYTGGGSVSVNATGGEQFWNDSWAKGNFTFKQWFYNFRDWWESYRCILQAHLREKDNLQRVATDIGFGGNCQNADGDLCCPPCPSLDAPAPVRFKVINETLTHECDGSDAGCTTLDVGNFMEEGNERNGGSKWLQSVTCNQYCVVHSPCAPCMAYVQPASQNVGINADPTDKAIDMPFFGDGNQLDWFYGTLWVGRVEQWMPDPLWQPFGNGRELLKCGKEGEQDCNQVVEDDGTCTPTHFDESSGQLVCTFPQRPYEEAQCGKPDGAPDLPTGSRIMGCADYVTGLNSTPQVINGQDIAPGVPDCGSPYNYYIEWVASVDPHGSTELDLYCDNPDHCDGEINPEGCEAGVDPCGGTGNGHYRLRAIGNGERVQCYPWTPWLWLINQQACVANDGVFATDYRKNGTIPE